MENEVVRLLRARHATRAILREKLPDAIIEDLIEAARLTPSCYNNQPWRFLFLESAEALEKAKEVIAKGNWQWASRAPLIIVGHTRRENDCVIPDGREYHQFDLGMACMNIMLAATFHDLVARPMAGFNPARAREIFGLGEKDQPFIAIAVGRRSDDDSHVPQYARSADSKPRERKPAAEIVRRL
jgi:nitroreductase